MNTSLLKSLDRILHPTACVVGTLLSKAPSSSSDQPLILRPGGMGDLICADIALENLALESRNFLWLIERRSQAWAQYRNLPHLCYDENPLTTLTRIRGRHRVVINTEQLFGLTQAYALLAKAPGGQLTSFATNRGANWADTTVPYDWRDEPETLAFSRLFSRALKHSTFDGILRPRTRLRPASRPPLVMIAGRQSPSRRLSLETWMSLITSWSGNRFFSLAAAPEDAAFADQLSAHFPGQASRFTGTFPELCEEMAQSEEVLSMDGGPVHIASYFGVPTLALFTSGRDHKWHPQAEGSRVLRRHDLPCQPCTKFGQVPPCPNHYACLNLADQIPKAILPGQY